MPKINGEEISDSEATRLLEMLKKDAKQVAGEFHNMNRSKKFRVNWPNEYLFVESEWKTFVEATRQMYVARLRDPKLPPEDGRMIHLALVLDAMRAQGKESDNRLQVVPGSQQFEGDRRENKKIAETFGDRPNFRAQLRAGAAKILPN